MAYQGFVFSEATSALSDAEFDRALENLDWAARAIRHRAQLIEARPELSAVVSPDEGWHPDSQPSFELDGSTKNAQTSYRLLANGDRDVIRKLRLYGHAFTGYQLATLEFARNRPWVARKLPDNWDEFLGFLAGPPDSWVFKYVAVAGALPHDARIAPPYKFGEIGWLIDGAIVNADTYSYQQIVCLLYENGVIDHLRERRRAGKLLKIVEIGSGFGGLAYHLFKIFDRDVQYALIDIPESLAFSSIYCTTLFPDVEARCVEGDGRFGLDSTPGFTFVPNTLCPNMRADGDPVDLVINTLSLSEMSDKQIADYCKLGSAMIGEQGIFFEQNHQKDHLGPGGLFPTHFKNLRKCASAILPSDFEQWRGQANLWVNATYRG